MEEPNKVKEPNKVNFFVVVTQLISIDNFVYLYTYAHWIFLENRFKH